MTRLGDVHGGGRVAFGGAEVGGNSDEGVEENRKYIFRRPCFMFHECLLFDLRVETKLTISSRR